MSDTFKGIVTADGKKRQLPYGSLLDLPSSDPSLTVEGGFADAAVVGEKNKKTDEEIASLKQDTDDRLKNNEADVLLSLQGLYSDISYKDIIVRIIEGEGIGKSGEIINWTNCSRTDLIPVIPGRSYKVSCRGLSQYMAVAYFSSSITQKGTFVSAPLSDGIYIDRVITIPEGVYGMILSMAQTSTYGKPCAKKSIYSGSKIEETREELESKIEKIREEFSSKVETETEAYLTPEKIYEERDLYIVTDQGRVFLRTNINAKVFAYKIKKGSTYKITASAQKNGGMIATANTLLPTPVSTWDSYENYIEYKLATTNSIENITFTASSDCYIYINTIHASITSDNACFGKKIVSAVEIANIVSSATSNEKWEMENLERRVYNAENKVEFAWAKFDKPYFCFIQDDLNDTVVSFINAFHNKSTKLSEAIIPSNITDAKKEVLDILVKDGGEILAHYSGNPNDDTSDDEWLTYTRDIKKMIESYGYKCRGIIRAGNTGESTKKGEKYCRKYFDYADDKMGISPQYDLPRVGIWNFATIDDFKAWIDTCANINGIHGCGFHGVAPDKDWVTPEAMGEIIDYIKNKGNCEITTYSDLFDRFGSSSFEQRILALESKLIN